MSEQTTETVAESGGADPSMEDILASIRRIIADDAVDSADNTNSEDVDVRNLAEPAPVDKDQNTVLTKGEVGSSDSQAIDFDDILIMDDEDFSAEDLEIPEADLLSSDDSSSVDMLSGDADALDAEILELLDGAELESSIDFSDDLNADTADIVGVEAASLAADVNPAIETMPEPIPTAVGEADSVDELMEMFDNDIDLVLDMEGSVDFTDISVPDSAVTQAVVADVAPVETKADVDDDDFLGSILSDSSDTMAADAAALEDLISQEDDIDADDMTSDDNDLDLVKSLMADLTDEPLHSESATDNMSVDGPLEEGLVDDILDLTMDDEESLFASEETGLETVAEATPAPDMNVTDDSDVEKIDASINALLEIAASAESDASGLGAASANLQTNVLDVPAVENNDEAESGSSILDALDIDLTEGFDLDAALGDLEATTASSELLDANEGLESLLETSFAEETDDDLDIDTLMPSLEEGDIDDDLDDLLAEDSSEDEEEDESITDIDDLFADDNDEAEEDMPDFDEAQSELNEIENEFNEDVDAELTDLQPETVPEQENPEMPKLVAKDTILDDVTENATTAAFASLNQVVEDKAVLAERGPRVGDIVQDALRPMLKEWLDENLKGIVERAVAKEVKRISTGK